MRMFTLILYTGYWAALSYGIAWSGFPTAAALIGATGAVIMYRAWEAYLASLGADRHTEDRVNEMIVYAYEHGIDVTGGLSKDELDDLAYLFLYDIDEFEYRYRELLYAATNKHDDDEWDGDAWYDDMLDEFDVDDDIEYRGDDL